MRGAVGGRVHRSAGGTRTRGVVRLRRTRRSGAPRKAASEIHATFSKSRRRWARIAVRVLATGVVSVVAMRVATMLI